MSYSLKLFFSFSMEVGSKSKVGAAWLALEKFASKGATTELEREAILGSIFANKVCNFVDEKFSNLHPEVVWRWVYCIGRLGKKDICCGFKIDDEAAVEEVRSQIDKFYKESLEGGEWWDYSSQKFFLLVSPKSPNPFSFRLEPARDYKRSRRRGDDESEAFGCREVKDETDPGPIRRGRKRRGGVSGHPQKRTSLGGEAENI